MPIRTAHRRAVLAGLAGVLARPGATCAQAAPVRVALETAQGRIVIELALDKAPVTAANFLRYVDQKRYDGASFYRASKAPGAPQAGMVQGGLNSDPAKKLKPIAHESTAKTGLTHKDGAVSLARRAQGTATSEFFICLGDQSYLDADPAAPGDNAGFAVFGQVVEGMETVRAILALPTSRTGGGPGMEGEMLARPVQIVQARRTP